MYSPSQSSLSTGRCGRHGVLLVGVTAEPKAEGEGFDDAFNALGQAQGDRGQLLGALGGL